MIGDALGLVCSVLRVVALAAIVLTGFVRLPAEGFIVFSQFHVGLSLASFLECVAAVERSRLYATGPDGRIERRSLLTLARSGGLLLIVGGAVTAWASLPLGALLIGAGVAMLGLPESAILRDMPGEAARWELAALCVVLVLVGASWFLDTLPVEGAIALLCGVACAPRVALSLRWRPEAAAMSWAAAGMAVRRNVRTLAPFITNQSALPWMVAAPAYAVPMVLPAKEASWILFAMRAAGAVSSMLARTLTQRWIRLVDGEDREHDPRALIVALAACVAVVVGSVAWTAPPVAQVLVFGVALSLASALQAYLSTQLNAKGRFIEQLLPYAAFWLAGSACLLTLSATGWWPPTMGAFLAVQSLGVLAGVAGMAALAHRQPAGGHQSSNRDR